MISRRTFIGVLGTAAVAAALPKVAAQQTEFELFANLPTELTFPDGQVFLVSGWVTFDADVPPTDVPDWIRQIKFCDGCEECE